MEFLCVVGTLFFATRIAEWISILNGVGSCGSNSNSWKRCVIHVVCWAAAVAVMYSASHENNAVIDCFIEPQHMGVPLYRCTNPDMDFWLVTSAATSASLYVSRRLWIALMVALRLPALYSSSYVGVCWKYRMRGFGVI